MRTATDIIRRVAPQSLVERAMTVADIKDESVTPRRLIAVLISSFGILAVLIAAVGMAGALFSGRVIRGLLYGVEPSDLRRSAWSAW